MHKNKPTQTLINVLTILLNKYTNNSTRSCYYTRKKTTLALAADANTGLDDDIGDRCRGGWGELLGGGIHKGMLLFKNILKCAFQCAVIKLYCSSEKYCTNRFAWCIIK